MLEGNLKLHQIYRALDLLSGHKEDIEKDLYWHGRDGSILTGKWMLSLYDCNNFEI